MIALFCRQYDIIKDNEPNNNKDKAKNSSECSTPEHPQGGLLRSNVWDQSRLAWCAITQFLKPQDRWAAGNTIGHLLTPLKGLFKTVYALVSAVLQVNDCSSLFLPVFCSKSVSFITVYPEEWKAGWVYKQWQFRKNKKVQLGNHPLFLISAFVNFFQTLRPTESHFHKRSYPGSDKLLQKLFWTWWRIQ